MPDDLGNLWPRNLDDIANLQALRPSNELLTLANVEDRASPQLWAVSAGIETDSELVTHSAL
ncbi:hypothetical protein [Cupriavidus basilensis]|uniref:hypothetical protein n=1 Tax=Cupriavidus basilensis TaxID=68895 RepID=UPI0002F72996|nr:hypothetical protein [Cupriavidus basilensis]